MASSHFAYSSFPQFSLAPDPSSWGAELQPSFKEADDWLHNPDPRRDRKIDKGGTIFTSRGLANLGCLVRSGFHSVVRLLTLCDSHS